ncbi:copper amine oxidase [Sphaerosporella brunnea]|uniref:Amine oxidase n=1 Tax=Sphaerosporella brunnea TaxID=1250544 RepID=A0A5J5EUN5_9PEZI|nr:copper amine oxidase [Sphaerosporella brunnea]
MKLLSFLAGALSLTALVEGRLQPRGFRAKNQRGTRHSQVDPRDIAFQKRSSSPPYLYAKRSGGVDSTCVQCYAGSSAAIAAPKENIWAPLSSDEAADVADFLFAHSGYNLTLAANATDNDNTLALVELLAPNKSDALSYLDGAGRPPTRYAHVVLDIRAVPEPYIQDFTVGPLPVVAGVTKLEPLNWPFNKGEGKQRNYNADEDTRSVFLAYLGANMSDITTALWGQKMTGGPNDTLSIWGIDPLWQEDGRIVSWDQFWGNPTGGFDSSTLLPLGLYIKTDITGRDPFKWAVLGLLYNDIFYESLEAFRKAFFAPGFVRLGANVDGSWAHTDREGPVMERDQLYPPIQIAPDGGRFGVDADRRYVEWMDFSFYITFTRDSGVRLYDIKYKGDRIIYELGLQEALAHYAGNDPVQSGTSYLDTYYGFGPWAFELLPGFDCPTYATFLNTSYWTRETHTVHPNSICLFEQDAGYPMSRHTAGTYAASTKNVFFTLRSICTVGNYDYMFSYSFYIDGSVHVDVRASGYIQSAYFAHNEGYGFKIHDNLSGSMHDHVLNFKVDVDILGTQNSVATAAFVAAKETYSWSGGKARSTFKLEKGWVANEDHAKIVFDANSATSYTVVNRDRKNKYGEYRGYKVRPSTGPVHATAVDSSNLHDAAAWSRHHMYITKRKDTEPRSYHAYNSLDPQHPVVNFAKFLDGESLAQEDLALWINLGMHHAPHTGDLPNTAFTSAHAGFVLEPSNYLLANPAKQTIHMARVSFGSAAPAAQAHTFGARPPTCDVAVQRQVADLSTYSGDVSIRKFPFDMRGELVGGA